MEDLFKYPLVMIGLIADYFACTDKLEGGQAGDGGYECSRALICSPHI